MNWKGARTALASAVLMVLALAAIVGCTSATSPAGQIELSTSEFDFGTIPNTDPVNHVFQVRNVGRGELEIIGVSTSCGCTTAEVGGRRLAPGEATDLTVTYNPQVHGGETGQFLRIVYIQSNDPETPEASLTIRVTVVEPGNSAELSRAPAQACPVDSCVPAVDRTASWSSPAGRPRAPVRRRC